MNDLLERDSFYIAALSSHQYSDLEGETDLSSLFVLALLLLFARPVGSLSLSSALDLILAEWSEDSMSWRGFLCRYQIACFLWRYSGWPDCWDLTMRRAGLALTGPWSCYGYGSNLARVAKLLFSICSFVRRPLRAICCQATPSIWLTSLTCLACALYQTLYRQNPPELKKNEGQRSDGISCMMTPHQVIIERWDPRLI